MNKEVFDKYKVLFSERCNKIELVRLGEDSIRYDFFLALSEVKRLSHSDIQLEYSIDKSAYKARKNEKSKRKENPQIDLVVEAGGHKLSVEFGLFKQNSNDDGTINKTAKTVKMLNDMIRLALDSKHTERDAYFICVADEKMLGHQLQSKLLGKFPSCYKIDNELIQELLKKKTRDFDERFLHVFKELDLEIDSKIVYNEKIEVDKIKFETRIIIWKVESSNKVR